MSTDCVLMGIKREYFGINGNIRGIKESVAVVPLSRILQEDKLLIKQRPDIKL
jgi:hypothetical protein